MQTNENMVEMSLEIFEHCNNEEIIEMLTKLNEYCNINDYDIDLFTLNHNRNSGNLFFYSEYYDLTLCMNVHDLEEYSVCCECGMEDFYSSGLFDDIDHSRCKSCYEIGHKHTKEYEALDQKELTQSFKIIDLNNIIRIFYFEYDRLHIEDHDNFNHNTNINVIMYTEKEAIEKIYKSLNLSNKLIKYIQGFQL